MRKGLLAFLLLAFVLLGIVCLGREAPAIEADLATRAAAALAAEGFAPDGLSFSGRDAWLAEGLTQPGTFEQASMIVASVPGVRVVYRTLEPAAAAPPPPGRSDRVSQTVETGIRAVLQGRTIEFEPGSMQITSEGRLLLTEIASLLSRQPEVALRIEGHTDASGDDGYNLELSRRRAEVVRAFLFRAGIDLDQLTAVGFGESRPIADNETEEGRRVNRRIEFHVFSRR